MRRQPYPVALLTGGLDVSVDAVFLADQKSSDLQNVFFDKGIVRKNLGFTKFGITGATGLPLDGTPMLLDEFPTEGGSIHQLMTTTKWVYKYSATAGTYTKRNQIVTAGANSLVFDAAKTITRTALTSGAVEFTFGTHSITRAAGDFTADGFIAGGIIITNAPLNSGPFTIVTVAALTIVVVESLATEVSTCTITSRTFVQDGFTIGMVITTDAPHNPGPFTIAAGGLAALVLTVTEAVVGETETRTILGPSTGVAFTGDEDNQFSSVVTLDRAGTDLYLLTNGKDAIQKWDGGVGSFADLQGWKAALITAKGLVVYKSMLIAGGTTESSIICPRRIRWSIIGDPEVITGTGSGFVDLVDTSDWFVAFVILKNRLFVIKERSIWELAYVGGTKVFDPIMRVNGIGSYAPKAVLDLGEEIFIYGIDDMYLYDGLDLAPIGSQIYPYLFDTEKRIVNAAKANRVAACYIEEQRAIWTCFPTEGDVPNLLFVYDFTYGSWTKRNKQMVCFGYYTTPGSTIWSELTDHWDDQTWNWMDKPLATGAPTTLIGTADGNIWEDDRLTKDTDYMCYVTKDWMFAHGETIVEFRIQAKGGPFAVSYSLDQGKTWNPTMKTFPISTDWTEYVWYLKFTCQHVRMKIESIAEDLQIKWVEPWYIPRERSKELQT